MDKKYIIISKLKVIIFVKFDFGGNLYSLLIISKTMWYVKQVTNYLRLWIKDTITLDTSNRRNSAQTLKDTTMIFYGS